MSGKFKTTSSSLFTNNNKENDIPQWLEGIADVELKDINKIDLDISPKATFAEKNTVNRDTQTGELRYVHGTKLSSDRMVIDSKIQLSKFLLGKYYKTTASATEDEVQLFTQIDGVATDFIFRFKKEGTKIASNNTFVINMNDEILEYPFSKAGLAECIKDVKSNKITTSKKVESIGKASLIQKEEIIRRFNGSLRQATDKINELVKNGDIMGVGSNTFASYYDMDYLFPSMEKEAAESPIGAFEFAPNTEHVAAKPYKNKESFIIDTEKVFKNIFVDYKLINLNRDNDNLNIEVQVLDTNGITHAANFKLNITNEKISNIHNVNYKNNNFTLEEFITNINNVSDVVKCSNSNLKKIYSHQMYTRNIIGEKLSLVVNSSLVNDVIDSWIDLKLIDPINSELFTSKKSFAELLNNINITKLSNEEINNILKYSKKFDVNKIGSAEREELSNEEINYYSKTFGENPGVSRVNTADTGSREVDNCITLDNLLTKCNQYIYKYIKDYSVVNFEPKNNSVDCTINFFNKKANVDNTIKLTLGFDDRKIINCYMEHNGSKVDIENIKNTFITDEDIINMKTYSKKFGEGLSMNRYDTEDTGTREVEDNITSENILSKCNQYISKHIKKYSSINFEAKDNSADYTIKIFNEDLGLNNTIKLTLGFNDKKIIDCYAEYNGEKIGIEKIGSVFTASELLKNHLKYDSNKKNNSNIIISKDKLKQKLLKISSIKDNDMDQIINNWENTNKITKLNSQEFTSKYTFEELLNMSNINPLTEEEIMTELKKQQRNKNTIIQSGQCDLKDQDSRTLEAKSLELSPKMIELRDKIKNTVDKALNNKIITSKKHTNFNLLLSEAKNERDLENIWKDFEKYTK